MLTFRLLPSPTQRAWSLPCLLLAVAWLLSGCAAVSVSTISPGDYLAERRGDVLTTGRLSERAREVLRVIGIQDCQEQPEACRQTLKNAQGITDEQKLSTLSELWLEHALALSRQPGANMAPTGHSDPILDAWVESARHAYGYLFLTPRRSSERALEDRQTQVRDYYNYATQQAVSRLFAAYQSQGISTSRHAPVQLGAWQIRSEAIDTTLQAQGQLPRELIAAASLRFKGLRNTYRRDGLGAEFVAVLDAPHDVQATTTPTSPMRAAKRTIQPGVGYLQYPSVTVVLKFEGETLAEVMHTKQLRVQLYDPYRSTHTTLGAEHVPLAANFTAGYGLWLARSGFATQSLRTLFGLSDGIVAPRVQLMQPWNPERRIAVMLHGLASSPEAWTNVANEVMGDEQLRQTYQIWQVYYPTNAPLALNLRNIRAALVQALQQLDPEGTSVAAHNITLVGHSMGGVLARLLVSHAEDQLWQLLPPDTKNSAEGPRLQEYLRFDPLPGVQRAVFIAAPHRGTPFAEQRIARHVANLITLPQSMLHEVGDLLKQVTPRTLGSVKSAAPDGHALVRIPNSIDNLSDQDAFVQAAATLPLAQGLPFHSIIGRVQPEGALQDSSDGIVPYSSAHLDNAQSELVITSGHSVQEHPQAILEIRRILHLRP